MYVYVAEKEGEREKKEDIQSESGSERQIEGMRDCAGDVFIIYFLLKSTAIMMLKAYRNGLWVRGTGSADYEVSASPLLGRPHG